MTLLQEITLSDISFRAFKPLKLFTEAGSLFVPNLPIMSKFGFERFIKTSNQVIYDNHTERACYDCKTGEFFHLPSDFDSEEEFLNALDYLINN